MIFWPSPGGMYYPQNPDCVGGLAVNQNVAGAGDGQFSGVGNPAETTATRELQQTARVGDDPLVYKSGCRWAICTDVVVDVCVCM